MNVSREEVLRIAQLARLDIDPAEADALARELDTILDHMTVLQGAGANEAAEQRPEPGPTRADESGADPLAFEPSELSPDWEQGFFTVPRLAALDVDRTA